MRKAEKDAGAEWEIPPGLAAKHVSAILELQWITTRQKKRTSHYSSTSESFHSSVPTRLLGEATELAHTDNNSWLRLFNMLIVIFSSSVLFLQLITFRNGKVSDSPRCFVLRKARHLRHAFKRPVFRLQLYYFCFLKLDAQLCNCCNRCHLSGDCVKLNVEGKRIPKMKLVVRRKDGGRLLCAPV